MSDIKLSECLFVDLQTDEQRRDWFSLGRGVTTGIIAPALQPHLVIAYSKIVESSKLIEEQQARIAELEAKTSCCMGVGNGNGSLFVYGNHESIKAAQRYILERDEMAVTVNRLCAITTGGLANKRGSALDVLNEIDDVLQENPSQNLNDIKRDVAESAIKTALRNLGEGSLSEQDISSFAQKYANSVYPSREE